MDLQMITRKVALYGNSVVMSSIGTILQERPEFEVQKIEWLPSGISETPHSFLPDVILFDLATAPADLAISLLRRHPKVMLIGVDLVKSEMLVLSGEQSRLVTAADLVQVIKIHKGSSSGGRWMDGYSNSNT